MSVMINSSNFVNVELRFNTRNRYMFMFAYSSQEVCVQYTIRVLDEPICRIMLRISKAALKHPLLRNNNTSSSYL